MKINLFKKVKIDKKNKAIFDIFINIYIYIYNHKYMVFKIWIFVLY
jgi:hypothetical protein